MKKLFLFLILLFLFGFLPNNIYGQNPTPTSSPITVPGLDLLQELQNASQPSVSPQPRNTQISGAAMMPGENCGNINPPGNACCYFKPAPTEFKFPKPNVLGADQLVDLLNWFYGSSVKPFFGPMQQFTQKTIQACFTGVPSTPGDLGNLNCICIKPTQGPLSALAKLCAGVNAGEQGACSSCITGGSVWTSLGCISPNAKDFLEKTVLGFGVGLGGIMALICIVYSAFILQTSRGNPEKIKRAQELLTSCITGLMLIIFSIFILKLIGVDILKIPGFSR